MILEIFEEVLYFACVDSSAVGLRTDASAYQRCARWHERSDLRRMEWRSISCLSLRGGIGPANRASERNVFTESELDSMGPPPAVSCSTCFPRISIQPRYGRTHFFSGERPHLVDAKPCEQNAIELLVYVLGASGLICAEA